MPPISLIYSSHPINLPTSFLVACKTAGVGEVIGEETCGSYRPTCKHSRANVFVVEVVHCTVMCLRVVCCLSDTKATGNQITGKIGSSPIFEIMNDFIAQSLRL